MSTVIPGERIEPAELSAAEVRVLEAIDEQALVQDLVELIRMPSVTGTDAESDLQHRQAGAAERPRVRGRRLEAGPRALAAMPEHPGTESSRSEGYGVVGVLGPARAVPALVLQGHVDVVPTGDLGKWDDRNPFSGDIRGGAIRGRGRVRHEGRGRGEHGRRPRAGRVRRARWSGRSRCTP